MGNYHRALDDEMVRLMERIYDESDIGAPSQLYVPTESEQALADIVCFGNYNETGGTDGMTERDLPVAD